jgi:hypothetical protein
LNAKSISAERPPARVRDPHARDLHRLAACDHTLALRGRKPGVDQLDQQFDR